jgi:PAS domain S-box-containing protein
MVNPHYRAGSGMPDEPMVGRAIAEVFPDVVARGALEFIETVYRTGQTVSIREREGFIGPDRKQTYWNVDHVPLYDQDGDVDSVLILTREVTEQVLRRKQVEELAATLQRERNILYGIMGNTRAHLAYLDPEFNFVEVNATYAQGCGYSREALIGRNHFEVFPDAENQAIFERVRDTGEPVEFRAKPFEFPDRPELGTTYWDWTLAPVKDKTGTTQGLAFSLFDVTEQVRAQDEVESLSRFPRENPNPVLRMAKDGTFLYANAGSAPLLSWCDADVGQKGPDDWRQHVIEALDIGKVRMIEVVCDDLTFSLTIAPIPEEGYANLYGMDVTERICSERALRESEQKLRALFDILPIGISVLGDSRNVQLANPALAQILDLSQEQLRNGEYGDRTYLRADGCEMTPDEFPSSRAFRDQRPIRDVEIGIVKQDGERIWTNVNAVPLPFADWRVILTTSDITKQKLAEAALRQAHDELEIRVQERTAKLVETNEALRAEIVERQRAEADLRISEERFRQVAENIDEVLWLAEPESGQLLYINPAYERIWGRPVDNLPENVEELLVDVHPGDREQIARIREGQEAEFRIVRSDGRERWIRARVFPIQDDLGRVYRLAGVAEDISEEKRALSALLDAEQLAGAGKMAAFLSHEINNPLQAAIGCLDLGQEHLEKGADAHEYFEVAAESLQRASSIVERLRTLHQRADPADKETTNLNTLLERVLILTRKKCGDSDVEVIWVAARDLPMVDVIPDAMQQVFLNLILNALDAMPEGGQLQMRTVKTEAPLGVQIQLIDEGVGIPADVLPGIFEPFYTTKMDSLGLGLFISRSIVQQHGGYIEAQSQEGEGMTFIIWLPL